MTYAQPTVRDPTRETHAAELIRLRWVAIAGQVLTIAVAHLWLALPLPLLALGGVIAAEVCVNLGATWHARHRDPARGERLMGFMVVDLLVLTALLYLTGGPYNPFSFLYLVHIALAALILDARGTWALGILSIGCFGLLFLGHLTLPMVSHDPAGAAEDMEHAHGALNLHVQGMWVAFAVAALTITFFVGRLARALDERSTQLADARLKAYRTEKAAALATLAAGAAHELATPLSTIAIISKELEAEALQVEHAATSDAQRAGIADFLEDARLIRSQVDRCRDILDQLAVDTGQTLGESEQSFRLGSLLQESIAPLAGDERLEIKVPGILLQTYFVAPRRAVAHAMRALVKNALQASPEHLPVIIRANFLNDKLTFEVQDLGPGIPQAAISRVTEPFFSTKEVGEGMGLGLFLAQSVADTLGGTLELVPATPHGTRARLILPLTVTAAPGAHPQPGAEHL